MPIAGSVPRVCPRCGQAAVRRSRRKFYERPLKLVQVLPYRCDFCDLRFYRFGNPSQTKSSSDASADKE